MPIAYAGFNKTEEFLGGDLLSYAGPTISVHVGFDETVLAGRSAPLPSPGVEPVRALIDTGASQSCIDDALAQKLGLPEVDQQEVSGVGGVHKVTMYLGHIYIPALDFTQYGEFAGVNLSGGGQRHEVLLGRSMLRTMVMVYDGITGSVSISR